MAPSWRDIEGQPARAWWPFHRQGFEAHTNDFGGGGSLRLQMGGNRFGWGLLLFEWRLGRPGEDGFLRRIEVAQGAEMGPKGLCLSLVPAGC